MKIFHTENGKEVVYVQMQDIMYLSNETDIPIPVTIFTKVFAGVTIVDDSNRFKFVKFDDEHEVEFFKNLPSIKRQLDTLNEVGLDYIKLGQPSTQLSGGEAQRVKLATELSKRSTGKTLYILDEPTTGLHFADVDKLLSVLDKLTDAGNTVVVIEHNLDVIKRADYVIDLGPDGGDRGGTIIATGTPEEIAACENSYTGQFLKKMLK